MIAIIPVQGLLGRDKLTCNVGIKKFAYALIQTEAVFTTTNVCFKYTLVPVAELIC